MHKFVLGGVQEDVALPTEDQIRAFMSPDQLALLAEPETTASEARKLRLQVLLDNPHDGKYIETAFIAGGDYATWLRYFTMHRRYDEESSAATMVAVEELGLKEHVLPRSRLYFGESVFLLLRKRKILDAAFIGIPDDRLLPPVCLARVFRFDADYQRIPRTVAQMSVVVQARYANFRERRRFRREDVLGIFA